MRKRPKLTDTESARRAERWAFWAIPIGIAAIIVSVLVTYWAVHRSEEMTRASGALDKPQPRLYLGDIKVEQPLRVYVAAPFPEKSLTIVQLPLSVRNDGDKTTKGIELLVREPEFIAVDNSSLEAKVESHLPISVAPERHYVTGGKYAYISFAFPDMHPGQTFQVSEPIIARDSNLRTEVNAVTQDGVPVVTTLSMVVGLPVTVSIAGEDLHTVDYELEVLGIKATDEKAMVSAFADEIDREKDDYRKEKGFWRYMLDSLTPVHHRALLIRPDLEIVKADNGVSVYLARGISVAKNASYTMP
jgi:hypothetical protein